MDYRRLSLAVAACVAFTGGCGLSPMPSDGSGDTKAVIVGRIVSAADHAKPLAAMADACPNVLVTVNGSPVTIEFGDDCVFLIDGIQPAEFIEVRVELPDLGVAGTVELSDVLDGELIEILIEPTDDSLTVSVERRTTPDPSDVLPVVIDGNNVSISVPAGLYEQNLEVRGNSFTLVGEAGDGCDDPDGWTEIDGEVLVLGNNATFRNIKFSGPVELRGNNPRFINCCFGDSLVIFGNGADFDGDGDGDG